MFYSVFTKSLRDHRTPILGFGIGLGLFLLNSFVSYALQVTDPAARQEIAKLAEAFRFLGDSVALDTNEGLITWRIMSFLVPLILGVWTVRAGASMVRGAEEVGSLDILLATPLGRRRFLGEKVLALLASLVLIGLLFGLCGALGQAISGLQVNLVSATLAGLNMSLLGIFFAMLALLLSQLLPSQRAAAGWTGAILGLSALADGIGRVSPGAAWLQRLSPFYYYNLNKPLIVNYPANWTAVLVLAGMAAALAGIAVTIFQSNDLGLSRAVLSPAASIKGPNPAAAACRFPMPQTDWSFRSVGLRALRAQLPGVLGWVLGMLVYTAGAVMLLPAVKESTAVIFEQVPVFEIFFPGVDFSQDIGLYSVIVIEFLPLIVPFFALLTSLAWVNDLDAKETETVFAVPVSRRQIYVERLLAVVTGLVALPLAIWLAINLAAGLVGADFSSQPGFITAVIAGLIPLEIFIASLVFILSARLRANQVFLLAGGYLVLAFLLVLVNDYQTLPGWLMSLSIVHDYGLVIEHGASAARIFFPMLIVAGIFIGLGAVQFKQRDLGR